MAPMSTLLMAENCDDSATTSTHEFQEAKQPLSPSQGKRVRFDHHVDVKEVEHVNDMVDGRIGACWYTEEDFVSIKQGMIITLRLILANKALHDDQCARGLESRTPTGCKLRKQNKLNALSAVWEEQVAQWKQEVTDEEAISFVYQQQSYQSRAIARRRALQDQDEAREYLGLQKGQAKSSAGGVSFDELSSNTQEASVRASLLASAA